MNMEYCYFHIIYLKKNVGADWTCTSAEYMVYILKKYILIDGSVLPTASCLGIPDIVILMFEDWIVMGFYAVSRVSGSWNLREICGLNPQRRRGYRLCSLNPSLTDTVLHPRRLCSETVLWELQSSHLLLLCCLNILCIYLFSELWGDWILFCLIPLLLQFMAFDIFFTEVSPPITAVGVAVMKVVANVGSNILRNDSFWFRIIC